MLLGTLGAILLENVLKSKEIKAKIPDAGFLIPTHSLTNFRMQNNIIKMFDCADLISPNKYDIKDEMILNFFSNLKLKIWSKKT